MNRNVDWFAWVFQFVAGLLVGAFIGAVIISRRRRHGGGWWIAPDLVLPFIVGAALIGGGLASFYGDRLWIGSSYRVIPPDGVDHSRASHIASISSGVIGCFIVLTALIRHLGGF